MRLHQVNPEKEQLRRRVSSRGLSFGPIATAITVGVVALLLGVTFIGDWLRVPQVAAEASPSLISPNGDRSQDSTSFSYTLNEDAHVTVEVYNEAGRLVRTILANEFQTRGQHVVLWNGLTDQGQVAPDGVYRMQVTARGTVRSSRQAATVTIDTVPPALRLVNLDEVNRVNQANITIEGLTDPDAVVRLQGDLSLIPVSSDGTFRIKRQLAEGSNIIQVLATDPAGNVTTISREVILVTKPPEVVITDPPNDLWTNEGVMTVSGTAPPETTVKINGQKVAVGPDGQFAHEVVLQDGDNTIRLEAIDDVGNVATQELILHRKSVPPTLELNVSDGQVFQQSEVQLTGKTEAGATVLVNGQAVTVSPLGEFQTTVTLAQGDNILEVTALDQAGNVTSRQYRLTYDILPPESELARLMRNLPSLSGYIGPILLSLPVLLILAYFMTRPVTLVVSAESGSFQPGLPDEGRFLRLFIDLSRPARTTVTVKDKRGNVVATLLHRRHRTAGQHPVFWDGYDDFGRVAPPGEYTVEATASTTGGTVTGTLHITVAEDPAVHRQYLRRTPQQDDYTYLRSDRRRTERRRVRRR